MDPTPPKKSYVNDRIDVDTATATARPDWFTKLSRLECGAVWGVWRRLTFLVAGVGVCVASARAHV